MKQTRFIIQMDPYAGEIANIPQDKLIEWLFYCVDKKGVKVDAIFWEGHCFMEQESPCNNTQIYKKFQAKGINIMGRIIDECHKRGIKAYCLHRFSEVDTNLSSGRNEIKQKHRDWVIKTWWQEGLWNLASSSLQEFKLNYITKIMTEYAFDGICVDFLRHLPCLPVGKQWEYRECATEFMSKLKDSMNKLGRQVAVGAKLPENKESCYVDGFDVEKWAKNNLVDFVVGGSRTINPDIDWYKKITEGTSTLVYTCWDVGHVAEGHHNQTRDFYRGMFSNWTHKGADGVVIFNCVPAPYEELYKLLPPEEILHCLGPDCVDFYNILSEENLGDKALRYVADRRGGYPFLTGCGGNNVFAPLPAPIPNDETPLDVKIDVCGDFKDRPAQVRFVITNAKSSCDKFKIFLNGLEIKDFSEDYSYKDQQIFWPNPQPAVYTANCLNSNPAPILEIKAKVDGSLLKNGTNTISIAVIDRINYFLDSDSINVERAEIIVGAKGE
ncbi:MAG: hypothetical protein IJ400_04705 [Clostridia bacterium]|nr:hypothetical protein [Clostridia bacterium]